LTERWLNHKWGLIVINQPLIEL